MTSLEDEPSGSDADPIGVAVFASGGGSNFQSLLEHARSGACWRVALLVSNRACGAVERAEAAGVPSAVIPTRDRAESDVALDMLEALDRHDVSVILLAGYLRLLPAEVVRSFRGRILNIHPALLPDFGGKGMFGMNVHRAVVEAGVSESGATVHLVDEEYDRGQIFAQARVPVLKGDAPEDVADRVLAIEHLLYPRAVDHLCAALRDGSEPQALGVLTDLAAPNPSRDSIRPASHVTPEEKR